MSRPKGKKTLALLATKGYWPCFETVPCIRLGDGLSIKDKFALETFHGNAVSDSVFRMCSSM